MLYFMCIVEVNYKPDDYRNQNNSHNNSLEAMSNDGNFYNDKEDEAHSASNLSEINRVKNTALNSKCKVQNRNDKNQNEMSESQISKVIYFSMLLGKRCSCWQAEEALRPGRGYGDPEVAVYWLFAEGGFHALERQQKWGKSSSNNNTEVEKYSSNTTDYDFQYDGNMPLEMKLEGDTKADFDLEEKLKKFASENGIHENVAKNAINHCNTFESGCHWMLINLHATTIVEPISKKQYHHAEDVSQQMFVSNPSTTAAAVTSPNDMIEQYPDHSHWVCQCCTLKNEACANMCEACEEPSPSYMHTKLRQEELSRLKVEALTAQDKLEEIQSEQAQQIRQLEIVTKGLDVPYYWDPFPPGQTTLERELITKSPLEPAEMDERDRIIKIFIDGGMNIQPSQVVSLMRIQNLPMWQRYAAQRNLIASKPSNEGNPNVQYLFHGPKGNTEAIRKNGFIGQYGKSKPYGTWTHTSSNYSGTSFADCNPPSGGYRIFICQAVVGTPGCDNGSGRRPNEVRPGILADCHQNGGIHVFYEDSQLYPEYLIQWK